MRFRKKLVVIEAVQWTGENVAEVTAFLNGGGKMLLNHEIEVITVHGEKALIRRLDWIIPEPIAGRFYPCKPDIFEATYEPAE